MLYIGQKVNCQREVGREEFERETQQTLVESQ